MIALTHREKPATVVYQAGVGVPQTHSGRGLLVCLTPDEMRCLEIGDVVLYELGDYGLQPMTVTGVRCGVGYAKKGEPYEVPVVDGVLANGITIPAASCSDVWYPIESDAVVPTREFMSLRAFQRWAGNEGSHAAPMPVERGPYQ